MDMQDLSDYNGFFNWTMTYRNFVKKIVIFLPTCLFFFKGKYIQVRLF